MAENVYYNGELIPTKNWDYELHRPILKEPKKQPVVEVVEDAVEQIQD